MKNKKKAVEQPSTSYSHEIWKDERFSHLVQDPRFKELPQKANKTKIDKRFKSMLDDDKFKLKYSVDKYGRKIKKSSSEDLKKFYAFSDESDESDQEDKEKKEDDQSEEESDEEEEEEEVVTKDEYGNDLLLPSALEISKNDKLKLHDKTIDYARGQGTLLDSESSSDEESSEEENDELFVKHVWGELDHDAPHTDDITNRLAACNMDWDRIKAVDIMILCSSFLPKGGSVLKVSIYASEYGKERMAEEDLKGPPELTAIKLDDNENSDDDEIKATAEHEVEGTEYNMEKLREYQMNRLKYYYAVIEFDCEETADKIYQECDGIEYESSATKLDLRFIPNEETFDDEPTEVCDTLPDLATYKPRLFTTTALQQAKVDLTWDENDVDRIETNNKLSSGKLNNVTEAELRKYLAYSSEEDEDEEEEEVDNVTKDVQKGVNGRKKVTTGNSDDDEEESDGERVSTKKSIQKYKELLLGIKKEEDEKKKKQFEIEYSWGIGTQDKVNKLIDKKKLEKAPELSPFEKMIEKKKEKQKAKKIERQKMLTKIKNKQNGIEDDDEDEKGDDGGWSSDDLPDGVDMNDPYFAEEFQNGNFVEKPKKKTDNKKKGKKFNNNDDDDDPEKAQQKAELELLMLDDDDNKDEKHHFSLKKIQESENPTKKQSKRKMKLLKRQKKVDEKIQVEDNFEVNVTDKRFNALYTSHHFSIDPTDSHYKKTKGMETIITEKLKRRHTNSDDERELNELSKQENAKKTKKDVAVSMLVKSIKRKVGK